MLAIEVAEALERQRPAPLLLKEIEPLRQGPAGPRGERLRVQQVVAHCRRQWYWRRGFTIYAAKVAEALKVLALADEGDEDRAQRDYSKVESPSHCGDGAHGLAEVVVRPIIAADGPLPGGQ